MKRRASVAEKVEKRGPANSPRVIEELKKRKMPEDTNVEVKFDKVLIEGAVKAGDREQLVSWAMEVWGKAPHPSQTPEMIGEWLNKVLEAKAAASNPGTNPTEKKEEGEMKNAAAHKMTEEVKAPVKATKKIAEKKATKKVAEKKVEKIEKVATVTPITKALEKKIEGEPTWKEAVETALKRAGGTRVATQIIWDKVKHLIPGKVEKLAKGPHPDNAYRSMIMTLMKFHKRADRGLWTLKESK